MEQKDIVCSLCSASSTSKVKYFQLNDAIRPPNDSQFDGFTELHGVLENILNIKGENRKVTNAICPKCRDKLHGIYSFTLQHTESEQIFHQITDVTVRLKKLKTFFILTDLKKEFEAFEETDKKVNSLECSSTVCHNCAVSDVLVKMECENNFEGIDFNKVMENSNGRYSIAADDRSVEQRKIDSMGCEDAEQTTIEDAIIKEEWTLQEGAIFESKAKHDILDSEQTKFSCDICDEEFATVSCLNEHTKNVHENNLHEIDQATIEHSERHIQQFDTKNEFACDQCDAKYKSTRGLKDHKLFHAGITFECDQCDARYKSSRRLRNHKLLHTGVTFPCNKCDRSYSSRSNSTIHLQTVHTRAVFPCDQCDATYRSKGSLKVHKLIHSGITFNCDKCDAKYKKKGSLRQHKMSHTGVTFTCTRNQCNSSFSNERGLKEHLRDVHVDAVFSCNHCDATYKSKKGLKLHKQTHSGILFNCDQCDEKFKTNARLKHHKESHAGLTFTCNQCDASFFNKKSLTIHLRTVHTDAVFSCNNCDATYKNKGSLTVHKLIHSGKLFNCDQCDAKCKTYGSLRNHKTSHAGLKFNCDQCDASYKNKGSLKVHKLIHSGITFNCDQCDAKYKTKESLRQHKMSHTGVTFTCTRNQCNSSFSNKRGLKDHQREVHTGAVFSCDHCDATYKSKKGLKLHKQIHTGILFNCDQCGVKFKTNGRLTHHKKSHA